MKSKQKPPKKHQPRPAPRPTAAAGSWKRPLVLALVALLTAGGVWAFCEFYLWNELPGAIVGKWVVTEGPQEGATFDFYRSGAMRGRINVNGDEAIVKASVRIEERKLYATTAHPKTGEELTRVQVIRVLSATKLVLEDEQGKLLKMERAD